MTRLIDHLTIEGRFARSTSIERDIDHVEPLEGYLVTARALEVVDRIASVAIKGAAGDAWSIVGPYGSGKSSLAVLLDALCGPEGQLRSRALELLSETSPDTAQKVRDAHKTYGTESSGFVRALVTAEREPVSHTLLKALHNAALRHFGHMPDTKEFAASQTLHKALEATHSSDARRTGPSASDIVEIASALTEHGPLLIVIDEFGKNLEAIGESAEADPYFLQQLAEAGQGTGRPIYLLTLQHLAFEDYAAATADEVQQKEWAKVQGRFEDIPYIDSPTQTRALISTVFSINQPAFKDRIQAWAAEQQPGAAILGTPDLDDPERIADCYPLNPLTAAVLPDLCREFGQNERTLFSFLTSHGQDAVPNFLQREDDLTVQSVGLEWVYNYFMTAGVLASSRDAIGRRWNEITTRLNDTHGLTDQEMSLAKTIAVLNLAASGGNIRASREILSLLFETNTELLLEELEKRSLITFREFADEYRIWAGSDVNIESLVELELQYREHLPPLDLLNDAHKLNELVAARHSAQFETLRIFRRRYVPAGTNEITIEPPDALDERADGELILLIGDADGQLPKLEDREFAKPVVVAVPTNCAPLVRAAQMKSALSAVATHPLVESDHVAKREISERLAEAHAEFIKQFDLTFSAAVCEWHWLQRPEIELHPGRGTSVLSDVCDLAYHETPLIRSEMLNRFKLSSQGAKARRVLLEAMLEKTDDDRLGLEGYGPEVAMYLSVLEKPGIHNIGRETNSFGPPEKISSGELGLKNAWEILETQFNKALEQRVNLNDVYAELMSPPVGMKAGAIPVLLTAALIANQDEIAIYEHGSFVPVLTPPISERMVKNPIHFDIKHFANASGTRLKTLNQIASALQPSKDFKSHRVSNVLSVVAAIVGDVHRLDNYTRRTKHLPDTWSALRDSVTEGVEPDTLIFESIPNALGFPPIERGQDSYKHIDQLVDGLRGALTGLTNNFDDLLQKLTGVLIEAAATSDAQELAERTSDLDPELIDAMAPDLRAFVYALNANIGNSDTELMNHLATVVSLKSPTEWNDDEADRFQKIQLPEICSRFRRTLALHNQNPSKDSLNVILTRPDGSEDHRIIELSEEQQKAATKAIHNAAQSLKNLHSSRTQALDALLAAIGRDLLPPKSDPDS
tara:strand:+ start:13480 stop:16920 length:3441 start_codon:yes stop_codon:yes gene_type:complete